MKTKNIILTIAAIFAMSVGYAQFTSTLMTNAGTAHNFATGSGDQGGAAGTNYTFAASVDAGDGNGVCAVCHTPHNSNTDLPLWDHATSATSFTLYPSGGTIDGTITAPSGASALCLGCHDGSANLDSYGAALTSGTSMNATDALYASFGSDLSNDHPISITYPDDATAPSQQMNTPTSVLAVNADLLYEGGTKVECASCHSLHNPAEVSGLLRISNDDSALCLTCHAK